MPLIVYCTAASTLISDSVSYITFLFWEWRISRSFSPIRPGVFKARQAGECFPPPSFSRLFLNLG